MSWTEPSSWHHTSPVFLSFLFVFHTVLFSVLQFKLFKCFNLESMFKLVLNSLVERPPFQTSFPGDGWEVAGSLGHRGAGRGPSSPAHGGCLVPGGHTFLDSHAGSLLTYPWHGPVTLSVPVLHT